MRIALGNIYAHCTVPEVWDDSGYYLGTFLVAIFKIIYSFFDSRGICPSSIHFGVPRHKTKCTAALSFDGDDENHDDDEEDTGYV